MAAFTMELWKAIEYSGGTISRPNGIAVMGGGNIGLNHYPIFDESHREILNGKIIDHYWNSEIGHETFHMWRQAFQTKMNEIMPPINKLYLSELIEFDPLATVNLRNLSKGENEQVGKSESDQSAETSGDTTAKATATSASRGINSSFPQSMLSASEDYASSGADATGRSTQDNEGTQTGKSDSLTKNNDERNTKSTAETTTQGFTGPAALLLMQYRQAIINVDMMVIEQLAPLFMTVLDTGNSYFGGRTNGYAYPYTY